MRHEAAVRMDVLVDPSGLLWRPWDDPQKIPAPGTKRDRNGVDHHYPGQQPGSWYQSQPVSPHHVGKFPTSKSGFYPGGTSK